MSYEEIKKIAKGLFDDDPELQNVYALDNGLVWTKPNSFRNSKANYSYKQEYVISRDDLDEKPKTKRKPKSKLEDGGN